MSNKLTRMGESAFQKMEKISSELFTLTYGAVVTQLLKDYEDVEEVNKQLERMGFSIGARLIDEFLAKTSTGRCSDLKETAEVVARVGLRMFLNVTASVASWNSELSEFSLVLDDNPLVEFVELPEAHRGLSYSAVLAGVLRGALEMVQLRCDVRVVRDVLRGDETTEIRVVLKEVLHDEIPAGFE